MEIIAAAKEISIDSAIEANWPCRQELYLTLRGMAASHVAVVVQKAQPWLN